ncbi:MAG: amidase, partial [Mycobacteriaceae bacterium]|nr:amidase [Mycobacteriaceae bacterium]
MSETGADRGLAEMANAISAGRLTSRAAVAGALDRIEAAQPALNAFRVVRRAAAL